MRRFWFLAVALLLIWLDIMIVTDRKYPEYKYNDNYGRRTQDFVTEDVVGECLSVDIASDIPGLLILIVLVLVGGPAVVPVRVEYDAEGKRKLIPEGKLTKLGEVGAEYDLLGLLFCILSIAAVLVKRFLPFLANGVPRYAGEYLTHLADVFLPLLAVFFVYIEWIRRTDRRTTHRESDVAALTMMVGLFCGFFSRFAELYGFSFIHYTAWILEGFLFAVSLVMMFISLQENARKILDPDPEPGPDELLEEPADIPRYGLK